MTTLSPGTLLPAAFASYEARTTALEGRVSGGLAGTFDLSPDMAIGAAIFEPTPPGDGYTLVANGLLPPQVAIVGNGLVRGAGVLTKDTHYIMPLKWMKTGQSDQPFTLTFIGTADTPTPEPFDVDMKYVGVRPNVYQVLGDKDHVDVPVGFVREGTATPFPSLLQGTVLLGNINGGGINTPYETALAAEDGRFSPEQNTRKYVTVNLQTTNYGSFGLAVSGFSDEHPEAQGSTTINLVDSEEAFPAGYVPRPFVASTTPGPVWDPPSTAPTLDTDFKNWVLDPADDQGKTVDDQGRLNVFWSEFNINPPCDYYWSKPNVTKTKSGNYTIVENDLAPIKADANGVMVRTLTIRDCRSDNVVDAYNTQSDGTHPSYKYASPYFQLHNIFTMGLGYIELDADIPIRLALDPGFWRYRYGADAPAGHQELDFIEIFSGLTNRNVSTTFHNGDASIGYAPYGRNPTGRQKRRWKITKHRFTMWTCDVDGSNMELLMDCPNYYYGKPWPYFIFSIEGPGSKVAGYDTNSDFAEVAYRLYGFKVWETDGADVTPLPTWTTAPSITSSVSRVGWPLRFDAGVLSYGYPTDYQMYRDDGPILGASGGITDPANITYTPTDADAGHAIWCKVNAGNPYGYESGNISPSATVTARAAAIPAVCAEAQAYLSALPAPLEINVQLAVDQAIRAMVASGAWAKLDGFTMAVGNGPLVDWRTPARVATVVAGSGGAVPVYTAGQGWTFAGGCSLDTGYDPYVVPGAKWRQDDASLGIRCQTPVAVNIGPINRHGSVHESYIGPRWNSDGLLIAGLDGGDSGFLRNTASRGLFVVTRYQPNELSLYRNGVPRVCGGNAFANHDAAVPVSSGGTVMVGNGYEAPVSGWLYGGGLTRADVQSIDKAVHDFRLATGLA